jgi:hypothetical protein
MTIPDFNERVNTAIRIVKEKYPDAQLYEAFGVASEGFTCDPGKIDKLKVVFRNNENSVIIIQSANSGSFGEPVLFFHSHCENVAIKWPVQMDLTDANKLKENAGYNAPYKAITLRNSLGSKTEMPYFVFVTNCNEPSVFVDITAGKVFCN